MGALILDASVLIALLDTADRHHERAVADVEHADLQRQTLLAPASAYSETLVAFARADRIADAHEAITAMGIAVAPLTATISEGAAGLRAQHRGLRLPDAMVVGTALELDADLLTYDARLAKIAKH